MYNPKFSLTAAIVNHLAMVERYYGQLVSRQHIPSLALKLTEKNRLLATHYSTSIEGNPLTPQEVTNVILDDKIPTNKSETEVRNYFDALLYISTKSQQKQPLDTEFMLATHRKLIRTIAVKRPGKLRDTRVVIGHQNMAGLVTKHNPPAHRVLHIELLLADLFNWISEPTDIHPLIVAGILHHELAYIHPFYDGNGRIARLMTAYYLLLRNYEVTKFFILDDYYDVDRLEYSDQLHSADSGDKTLWLEYFLEGIGYSLKSALGRIDEFTDATLERVKGEKRALVTRREEDVLQMVIAKKQLKTADVVKALDVTRQQAQSLLHSLVDKELLAKHGKTKSSYYMLRRGRKKLLES